MASRIQGITVEIGGDTTKLSSALSGVNKEIKNTQTQLKDVEKLLKLDPSNTELVAQKQKLLKDAIAQTKEKLDTLKLAAEQANEQLQKGEITQQQYDALQREIQETEQTLKSLEAQAASTNTTLAKIEEVGGKMEKVGNSIAGVGKKMSVVSAAIAGVGAAAVKTTAEFDSQMSTVKSISGATAEEFDALREKALEMGSKTSFSATEAGQAMEYMALAGWKTQDMVDGIAGIMDAAAASGENLATTSDIITDGLTAFGLSAKDSAHFADVLVKTGNSANTTVSMMGETFKYAGAVCGSLGISIEDAAIATGLMGNAGIKASNAGTALRTGLTNLVKPTDQMATAMEKYGVAVQTNADGNVDLMATMENCRRALGGLEKTEQAAAIAAIFGKNAMSGWSAIVNASEEDFYKLTEAIYSADGAAQEAAAIKLDNLQGQITILKSTLEGIAIQIGDILMPTVRAIVANIQEWATAFSNLDRGNQGNHRQDRRSGRRHRSAAVDTRNGHLQNRLGAQGLHIPGKDSPIYTVCNDLNPGRNYHTSVWLDHLISDASWRNQPVGFGEKMEASFDLYSPIDYGNVYNGGQSILEKEVSQTVFSPVFEQETVTLLHRSTKVSAGEKKIIHSFIRSTGKTRLPWEGFIRRMSRFISISGRIWKMKAGVSMCAVAILFSLRWKVIRRWNISLLTPLEATELIQGGLRMQKVLSADQTGIRTIWHTRRGGISCIPSSSTHWQSKRWMRLQKMMHKEMCIR